MDTLFWAVALIALVWAAYRIERARHLKRDGYGIGREGWDD